MSRTRARTRTHALSYDRWIKWPRSPQCKRGRFSSTNKGTKGGFGFIPSQTHIPPRPPPERAHQPDMRTDRRTPCATFFFKPAYLLVRYCFSEDRLTQSNPHLYLYYLIRSYH